MEEQENGSWFNRHAFVDETREIDYFGDEADERKRIEVLNRYIPSRLAAIGWKCVGAKICEDRSHWAYNFMLVQLEGPDGLVAEASDENLSLAFEDAVETAFEQSEDL